MRLSNQEKSLLKRFLFGNLNVFAWTSTDMSRVDPSVICHWLSILPEVKPVKQKPRKMNAERLQALNEDVDRLHKACFIWESLYPDWLTNPVLVKKNEK